MVNQAAGHIRGYATSHLFAAIANPRPIGTPTVNVLSETMLCNMVAFYASCGKNVHEEACDNVVDQIIKCRG